MLVFNRPTRDHASSQRAIFTGLLTSNEANG
jgi:hypothetical protein